MTASGATAAAMEAAAQALWTLAYEDEVAPPSWAEADPDDRKDCVDTARRVIEAAAPVMLAAERERIAQELEHRANAYDSRAADGLSSLQLCPDEAESLQDAAATLRIAVKAIRGSVAGKPDTQGGHSG